MLAVASFGAPVPLSSCCRLRNFRAVLRQDVEGHDSYAPELMVVSPTMRCNLTCTGCYSANYDTAGELTTVELDELFRQIKDLGIYLVVVSGGEPFMREDLFDLMSKHNDMLFMTYTNGTLLSRGGRATALARLGNVLPCISVIDLQRVSHSTPRTSIPVRGESCLLDPRGKRIGPACLRAILDESRMVRPVAQVGARCMVFHEPRHTPHRC